MAQAWNWQGGSTATKVLLGIGAAALALVATGHPFLAVALAVVALLSSLLSTPPG